MQKERLISLDVFRGLTVLLMTVVNNPGSWDAIYAPLEHAKWNGCTPTDLVFPFFIFIVGAAISFAMPIKKLDASTFQKIAVRSLRIFCLGLFLNFFSKIELFGWEGWALIFARLAITIGVAYALLGDFSMKIKTTLAVSLFVLFFTLAYSGIEAYETVRIPGVLQRIAIVYFVVSLLYLKSETKTQIVVAALILIGYWALMLFVPVPGIGPANLEPGTNFAAYIDSILLQQHNYTATKTWDPEGILSTVPAIATGILGLQIGQILNSSLTKPERTKRILLSGFLFLLLGMFWSLHFPINKSLWSSSYVLFTAGLATLTLSLLYYIIDVKGHKSWTPIFLAWGVNPMLVFFFSGIIPRVLGMIKFTNPNSIGEEINLQKYLYTEYIASCFANPKSASLAGALTYVCIWCFILWIFYKNKRIFKV